MVNNMKRIIISIAITLVVGSLIALTIILYNKYDKISIISVSQEYNYVMDKDEKITVSLYFEKNNSFLSSMEQIESVAIAGEDVKLTSTLNEVIKGNKTKYNDKTYYEYLFSLSFPLYNDFSEPLFIEDAWIKINYSNGYNLSCLIGNFCIYFNSSSYSNNDISVLGLSSTNNEVSNVKTIVGINLKIKSNVSNIVINEITTYNPNYDFDYHNILNGTLEAQTNLRDKYSSYSYVVNSINKEKINENLIEEESMFLPLKYLGIIRYVDRLPIYILYTLNGEDKLFIIDDFLFVSSAYIVSSNGVNMYEYNYYSS